MAHFAEIRSSDNEVLRVVVISDEDVAANGGELSTQAETFVKNLLNRRKPVYEKSNLILNALNLKSLNNLSLSDIANKIC